MNLHPAHPLEQRARELDRSWLDRCKSLPLALLLTERAAHQRLYHMGEEWDSCWRCHALRRWVSKGLVRA